MRSLWVSLRFPLDETQVVHLWEAFHEAMPSPHCVPSKARDFELPLPEIVQFHHLVKVVLPSFLCCKVTFFLREVLETVSSSFLITLGYHHVFNVLFPVAIIT